MVDGEDDLNDCNIDADDDDNSALPFEANSSSDELRDGIGSKSGKATTRLRAVIRSINFQLIATARVESIFRLREQLPAMYIREYVDNQEHFSVVAFLRSVLMASTSARVGDDSSSSLLPALEKSIVYCRTDARVLRLSTDTDPAFAGQFFANLPIPCSTTVAHSIPALSSRTGMSGGGSCGSGGDAGSKPLVAVSQDPTQSCSVHIVCSSGSVPPPSIVPSICILQLSAFNTDADCSFAVRECIRTGSCHMLVVVGDMTRCKASQVTMVRRVVDEEFAHLQSEVMERCTLDKASSGPSLPSTDSDVSPPITRGHAHSPKIVFLLHIPSQQLQLRPCYQSVPLNGWVASYIDSFGGDMEDKLGGGGGGRGGEDATVDRMADLSGTPQWLRIAFGLSSPRMLENAMDEFRDHALFALEQVSSSFRDKLFKSIS